MSAFFLSGTCRVVTVLLLVLPALASAAGFHDARPEPDFWQLFLAGVLVLAVIGRKHIDSGR